MFFLIRTAFWLSIVVMLLPTPDTMKSEGGVGATQAISAASATMSDMKQFCIRQPDACEVGAQALTQFGHKAQASAKWLYEFLNEKLNDHTASTRSKPAPADLDPSQNTLTAADTSPAWRGPHRPTEQRQAEVKR